MHMRAEWEVVDQRFDLFLRKKRRDPVVLLLLLLLLTYQAWWKLIGLNVNDVYMFVCLFRFNCYEIGQVISLSQLRNILSFIETLIGIGFIF